MKKEKEFQAWKATFEGHTILVTNNGKAKLFIDGEEIAKEKGLVHLEYTLEGAIPNTDYIVKATLNGTKDSIVTCDLFIGKSIPMEFGKAKENGIFTAYTEEEIEKLKEDAAAAILITTIL